MPLPACAAASAARLRALLAFSGIRAASTVAAGTGGTAGAASPGATSCPAAQSPGAAPGTPYSLRAALQGDEAAAFDRIVSARGSCRRFDAHRPVPEPVLRKLVAAALRAPSGFNLQPWRLILVDEPRARARLASAMLAPNAERVQSAPLAAVFLADTQALRDMDAITDMEAAAGKSAEYLRSLPVSAGVYTGGSCSGDAARRLLGLAAQFGPDSMPVPTPSSPEAWAFKSVGLAAMSFMLAATAHGLGTHAMEGLDARRVRRACGVPEDADVPGGQPRWAVPLVVATGYEPPVGSLGQPPLRRSARLPSDLRAFRNRFDVPYKVE